MWIIADIGSTTTKVLVIENGHLIGREECETTVEKPFEDVEIGLIKGQNLIEKKMGRTIRESKFLFTSSAGGGLQIIAIGLSKNFTAKSAHTAALNAGAIVLDVLAFDDSRTPYERLNVLNNLKPDLLLFAGGFDGVAVNQVVEMAELLMLSDVHPKFESSKLPLIYAGNSVALPYIREMLEKKFLLYIVPNISPSEGVENFAPTEKAIIEIFINHVMSAAPGYTKLVKKAFIPPLPTPVAVEKILIAFAQTTLGKKNLFAFDMGGATTDCYSFTGNLLRRTVAANLGMTYSLPYVIKQTGIDQILSHLDSSFTKNEVLNFIGNRHIRPNTISETERELCIETVVAQSIIHEAFIQHQKSNKFFPEFIIGSGGFIAHYPEKRKLKHIIKKALGVNNHTQIAIDKYFILPHLGILSQVDRELALKLCMENVILL